jgi:hypothetical protein
VKGFTTLTPSDKKEIRNIGVIELSPSILLEFLQFEDGRILQTDVGCSGNIRIILEHPEMPELAEGDAIQTVSPMYTITAFECGHNEIKRDLIL